jgi:hypothetical protein
MPIILLPFAIGGLALTALGLGVKRILEELPRQPAFPPGTRGHEAWARHRQALEALRLARQRVRDRARAYGERQAASLRDAVEPFRALLERLERWEHARASEVLTSNGAEALSALPRGQGARTERQTWALLGAGEVASPALPAVLEWLENGWLEEGAAPVVVEGVSLYPAASCRPPVEDEAGAVRAWEQAREELGRVVAFLEAVHQALETLDARVASLHGKATAHLEYLDAASFEEGRPEPRERLLRLGGLMSALAESLRLPVLRQSGELAPAPAPLAE